MKRRRLKKSSVRLARLSQTARGRHHTLGRKDDTSRAREHRMSKILENAPRTEASRVVAGIPVAAI